VDSAAAVREPDEIATRRVGEGVVVRFSLAYAWDRSGSPRRTLGRLRANRRTGKEGIPRRSLALFHRRCNLKTNT
jgi:hypothetical protein